MTVYCYSDKRMDFRERLREEIEFSGLSYKELSAKTGISRRTIISYVSGQACMPSADIAVQLAKALHTSVEFLITGENLKIQTEKTNEDFQKLLYAYKKLTKNQQKLLIAVAEDIGKYLN